MTTLALTMVPLHQVPPQRSSCAQQALQAMELAVVSLGYTPHSGTGEWEIDVRLYPDRTWRQGRPVGIGTPVTATRVLLHQPSDTGLWWLIEYPARHAVTRDAHCRLAVMGDATLPLHPQDLGILEHLLAQAPREAR